jgi:hypothetical protein
MLVQIYSEVNYNLGRMAWQDAGSTIRSKWISRCEKVAGMWYVLLRFSEHQCKANVIFRVETF